PLECSRSPSSNSVELLDESGKFVVVFLSREFGSQFPQALPVVVLHLHTCSLLPVHFRTLRLFPPPVAWLPTSAHVRCAHAMRNAVLPWRLGIGCRRRLPPRYTGF